MNYKAYMEGQETLEGYKGWIVIRECRLIYDKYTCQECGRKRELRVHHLTYKRLGKEKVEDLITLCARCHNDIHSLDGCEPIDELILIKQQPVTERQWLAERAKQNGYKRLQKNS